MTNTAKGRDASVVIPRLVKIVPSCWNVEKQRHKHGAQRSH